MQKKLVPTLAAAVIGAGLLVGAAVAGSAPSAAPAKAGGSEAKRGGTLRINLSTTDFEYLDPALSYEAPGWQVLYMTNLLLLNYPDKPAPEGSRLVPDAATGFPRVSRDGRTYTFTIKPGLRFSDGSAVTAAAFKRAFERAASPDQGSPAIAFMHDVAGADERNEGKASAVSGVTAKGQTLTIRLTRANPTFLAEIAMPFFAAVKPSMAIDRQGISVYPSAGPYRIASASPASTRASGPTRSCRRTCRASATRRSTRSRGRTRSAGARSPTERRTRSRSSTRRARPRSRGRRSSSTTSSRSASV
jgi:ABC-type transport system substrate-binding protein